MDEVETPQGIKRRSIWVQVCNFTHLEVLEGSAAVVTSVGEGPERPEQQQEVSALLHPEKTEHTLHELHVKHVGSAAAVTLQLRRHTMCSGTASSALHSFPREPKARRQPGEVSRCLLFHNEPMETWQLLGIVERDQQDDERGATERERERERQRERERERSRLDLVVLRSDVIN
ncbi:hypothetical protein EYF80_033026 [Liparis tanakae]|uniref:Uncharacterized protein n=1 Tax=Liparis tanakae TaxID=230148 RepID=A0A4Z2GSX4_9TELE|nr:hypothetical protein EYF80_033026 [Liparis tanakae]